MHDSARDYETIATGADIDLVKTWQDLWRYRFVAVLITVLVTAAALVMAFVLEPVYRVTVVMLPAEESPVDGAVRGLGDLGALAAIAGFGGGRGDLSVEAEALLRSRKFTEDFIRERNLLPVLFADDWDPVESRWAVAEHEVPEISDGFQVFDKKVRRVGRDRKTGLISLSIDWTDRVIAADWANDLVRRVNEEMRARALADSSATIAQLEKQLASTSVVPLQESIAKLLEAQIKRQTFAKVRSEFALRVVDPAVVPGDDEQVFPRKPVFALGGLAGGVCLGVFAAVVIGQLRRRRTVGHHTIAA